MATHSSILAWEILRTEQPVRLQSRGSQSQTQRSTHTCTHTKCSPMKFCYYLVAKPCIKLAYILWVIDYLKMNAAFIFSDFLVEKFLI